MDAWIGLIGLGIEYLNRPKAMSEKSDTLMSLLREKLDPGRNIESAVVDDFVRGTLLLSAKRC